MQLAESKGYEVREEKIDVDYALEADECFCVGTAAVISSIGKIEHGGGWSSTAEEAWGQSPWSFTSL